MGTNIETRKQILEDEFNGFFYISSVFLCVCCQLIPYYSEGSNVSKYMAGKGKHDIHFLMNLVIKTMTMLHYIL